LPFIEAAWRKPLSVKILRILKEVHYACKAPE
jgi:hypothetical protein